MQLWLVRHAVAVDPNEFEGPDIERPLTPKGEKRFLKFVRELAKEVDPPELVLTSPLVRAVQTADVLRRGMGLKKKDVAINELLTPGLDLPRLLEFLATQDPDRIALVGHEPDFSATLSMLIGGGQFAFGKGYVAAVDFEDVPVTGEGRLRWFVGPRLATG